MKSRGDGVGNERGEEEKRKWRIGSEGGLVVVVMVARSRSYEGMGLDGKEGRLDGVSES